jgi:two-component system, OmpR family, KDP operon response regulator KdpE
MDRSRILVVDDDAEMLEAVRIRLGAGGHIVRTAMDGVQATRLAFADTPDLIVLDIGMPGGDGHTVAARLRDDPRTTSVPIIFLSGRTGVRDFERARANRVQKYLTKPFQVEELLLAVDELLERTPRLQTA